MAQEDKKPAARAFFMGKADQDEYPAWRYHSFFEPRLVQNEEEDKQAALEGWKDPHTPITAVPHLANWRHDLEDMNAEQLSLFAAEEFGVKLPAAAGVEKLLKAIWRLVHGAPQHKGRIALLAQSVVMNYDETIKQIQRHAEDFEFTSSREITL